VLATSAVLVVGGVGLAWVVLVNRAIPTRIELGQNLYAAHCASCHGARLEGEPEWQSPKPNGRMPAPPHDAGGHTWHHSDQELFRITKFGMSAVVPGYASDMPAFAGVLSDQEIEAVLAFIKSTWPERERAYQESRTKQAKGGKQ
jgi:mono/diheme cytochrome c family protein